MMRVKGENPIDLVLAYTVIPYESSLGGYSRNSALKKYEIAMHKLLDHDLLTCRYCYPELYPRGRST